MTFTCDICGASRPRAEMKVVSGEEVASFANDGFVPSKLPGWENSRRRGERITKQELWFITVERCVQQDWGICQKCLKEVQEHAPTPKAGNKLPYGKTNVAMIHAIVGPRGAGKTTFAENTSKDFRKKRSRVAVVDAEQFRFATGDYHLQDLKQFVESVRDGVTATMPNGEEVSPVDHLFITGGYAVADVLLSLCDQSVAIEFRDSQVRLDRLIERDTRPTWAGGAGLCKEEVVARFAGEQVENLQFREVLNRVNAIFVMDTRELIERGR